MVVVSALYVKNACLTLFWIASGRLDSLELEEGRGCVK